MNNRTNLEIISENESERYKESLESFSKSNNYLNIDEADSYENRERLNRRRFRVAQNINIIRGHARLDENNAI